MKKTSKIIAAIVLCISIPFTITACGTSTSAANKTVSETPDKAISETPGKAISETPGKAISETKSTGKRVYFAAPLFSQMEKDYNLKLTKVLEDHGYEVFLPQRDGLLAAELKGKTEEEKTQMIFEKDVNEVMKSDILFIFLDGRVPDEGASVELGLAYGNGKRCYGIKTDVRSVEIDMDINPMLAGCFTKLFRNSDGDELIKELEEYLSENEL